MSDYILRSECPKTILDSCEERFQLSKYYMPYYPRQWLEFNLSDFGLPSAEEILAQVKAIEEEIGGVRGWRAKGYESPVHKGFSLAYNPELGEDPYSTLGDLRLTQNFSRTVNTGGIENLRNSYHDSYAFSEVHPIVKKHLKLLDHFDLQLTRSRAAYMYTTEVEPYELREHRDEFPYHNLRVNIPLQTSPEFVLETRGTDEYGNELFIKKHLEVGKFYVWNTRIPHSAYATAAPTGTMPRIHLVLGLMPWINVIGDKITKNKYFGIHPFRLIEEGLIFKQP